MLMIIIIVLNVFLFMCCVRCCTVLCALHSKSQPDIVYILYWMSGKTILDTWTSDSNDMSVCCICTVLCCIVCMCGSGLQLYSRLCITRMIYGITFSVINFSGLLYALAYCRYVCLNRPFHHFIWCCCCRRRCCYLCGMVYESQLVFGFFPSFHLYFSYILFLSPNHFSDNRILLLNT